MKEDMSEFFDKACIGDLALMWVNSLPEKDRDDCIRYFQQFWSKGIILTSVPEGEGYTGKHFKELDPNDHVDDILKIPDLDYKEQAVRIKYYNYFREWVCKNGL